MIIDKKESSEKITIVRKAKKNNYSIISNAPVRDHELSWKAKGILWYLLQLPDDWKINPKELQRHSIDGRDSLSAGLKELEKKGYLVHENLREKGKFCGHVWIVHEEPFLKDYTENKEPQTENPVPANPHPANPHLLITKESESKDSSSILKTKDIVAPVGALSADADDLTSFFIQKLKERKADIKLPDKKKWAQEIDRMIRIDKRDPKKIRAMIDWIHRDSFWATTILSTRKLREQYDQIELQAKRKFDTNSEKKNKEYAIRFKFKYPESYKNLTFSGSYAINSGTGKEVALKMPYESFKKAFVEMFGIRFEDLNENDKK